MALTITKTKQKVAAAKPPVEVEALANVAEPEKMSLEELADAYGRLEDEVNAIKMRPEFAQFEMVSKELQTRIVSLLQPQDAGELKGHHYVIEIGAAAKAPAALKDILLTKKFMGDKTFFEVCSVTLADVRKYLNPEQCAQVLETDTGYSNRRKLVSKFLG